MNYILEKSNKQVVWINTDPTKLTGVEAWANFKPDQHEIVYSHHYNPQIGETFAAVIKDGITQDFIPQKVYNKTSGEERVLLSWEDKIDSEIETGIEPFKDSAGNLVEYQKYTDSGWMIDQERKKESLLERNSQIFYSKLGSYRGTVDYKGTTWDSGKTYLENIQKTLTLYNKQLILFLPEWRDANDRFHSFAFEELSELSDLIELDLFNTGRILYSKKWEIEEKIRNLKPEEFLDLAEAWS
ncbi:hypothetical protein LEP1GSC096_0022 [Leptospira interrogans serovar Hebdomadis str. R499]|uniref:hypothetical protein n=1 Tax=Leptospira interrogans TaxID=173 RepID=UPI0002978C9A|nr:hypothetical protein [Leptospira interrogans]EKR34358.1 hypothetical protein LEP1GSC096_0022 [Leptospira interrogans serovar Hebdomadis str. R499]